MSDLIRRQDATTLPFLPKEHREYQTNNLDDAFEYGWMELTKCIESLPSAEPKTGKWVKVIDEETPNVTKWHYECDQCRTGRYENGQRYCPNCGAMMLGEDSDTE